MVNAQNDNLEDDKVTIDSFERYKMLLDLMKYHQGVIWGSFTAFALTHSIFLGVFSRFAIDGALIASDRAHWGVIGAAIMGILFWLPWYVTYQRSNHYFIFRLDQAKRAEPPGVNILRGSMEQFTELGSVMVNGKAHKLPFLVRAFKTRRAIPLFVNGFAMIYLFFLVSQIPFVKLVLKQAF